MRTILLPIHLFVALTFIANSAPLSEIDLKNSRGNSPEPDRASRFLGTTSDSPDEKPKRSACLADL